jgi:hypothetical protein
MMAPRLALRRALLEPRAVRRRELALPRRRRRRLPRLPRRRPGRRRGLRRRDPFEPACRRRLRIRYTVARDIVHLIRCVPAAAASFASLRARRTASSSCAGRAPRRPGSLAARARSHCRFVPPLLRFIPVSLTYSVPLSLKRQCDRTLTHTPLRPRVAPTHGCAQPPARAAP